MAVMIRLARQGAKKRPNYLVVAIDKQRRRDGAYLERIGQYFPKAEKPSEKIKINEEALNRWVQRGATVSQTVGQLLQARAK